MPSTSTPPWRYALLAAAALSACGDASVAPAPVADAAADTPALDAALDTSTSAPDASDVSTDVTTAPDVQSDASVDARPDTPPSDAAGGARLEGLIDEAARGLCDALYRCCDAESRAAFFAPMRVSERLVALRDRIPADGRLDRAACPPLVADIYRIVPLGGWVSAAQAGRVQFRPAEADACLQQLSRATCGAEVRAALRDGTCFGFAPPEGGPSQRRVFARVADDGAPCVAITDGVGGALFGTCDPSRAYCCGGAAGRCAPVGTGVGVCRRAGLAGDACGVSPELRVCATGLECDSTTGRCVAPVTTPLAVGDRCAMGLRVLGECRESWCDLGGTDRCVALAADGATCTFSDECRGGACVARRCAADTFCVAAGP